MPDAPVTTKIVRVVALVATAITASALSILSAGPAFAATIDVCASGCTYSTIQAAVTAAADGDTIAIGAGTFTESVTIDKSLTLTGPNASTSPNTIDPVIANSARSAEAVLEVPAGDNINAINLTATAKTVVITGMTVDLSNAVYVSSGQRFLNQTSAPTDSSLTLVNNIFTGGAGAVEGTIVYKTGAGDSTAVVTTNRFVDGGLSNGMFINNQSANANLDLTITDNVWLNNAYTAGNFSTDGATKITGTISGNWLGNSTPGTSGVDNYDTRQAGFLFAGAYDGLTVKDNTFKDIEDVAIYFWNGFSGVLNITDNVIDGYNNVSGRAAILTRSGTPASDVSEVNFAGNSITNPTAGSLAVLNQPGMGILDARGNWWGSATPDFDALVSIPNLGHTVFNVVVDDWLTTWGAPAIPAAVDPSLADTGAEFAPAIATLALLLLLVGGVTFIVARRRIRRG